MSENIDLEIQKYADRLAHGTTDSDIDEAIEYYKKFRNKLATDAKLVGLLGYWSESFVKSFRNNSVSLRHREEILTILLNDFPVQAVEDELRTYFEKLNMPEQLELLRALQLHASDRFVKVIVSFEEELANSTNQFKTFNQKRPR